MGKTIEQLEADLLAVTDQVGRLMDQVAQKGFVPAFRCGHSGLLYPSNYVKDWGKRFGVGLGPDVCSEALDSDYDTDPPPVNSSVRRITDIMHGLRVCKAQMDLVMVNPIEYHQSLAVLDLDDEQYNERAPILLKRQLAKSGTIQALYAEYERRHKKGVLA